MGCKVATPKITYLDMFAIMDLVGFGRNDFLYYVREEENDIAGLELLHTNAMVRKLLRSLITRDLLSSLVTTRKGDAPTPPDNNMAYVVYEEQVPMSNIGEHCYICS